MFSSVQKYIIQLILARGFRPIGFGQQFRSNEKYIFPGENLVPTFHFINVNTKFYGPEMAKIFPGALPLDPANVWCRLRRRRLRRNCASRRHWRLDQISSKSADSHNIASEL